MSHQETSIVFTGDISFIGYMNGRWNDEKLLSKEVLAFCRSADHVAANVEGSLYKADPGYDPLNKGMFCLSTDPAAVRVLDDIAADIWCVANNHSFDMGREGFESTAALAKQHGAKTLGGGLNKEEALKPVILPECGGIGLLGLGYPPPCPAAGEDTPGVVQVQDIEAISRAIVEVKKSCRYCVVVAHGGEEFTNLPHPYIRDLYTAYIKAGADAVIGHHPHVIMNYEYVDGKPIFYSLGNFILTRIM